MKKKISFAWKLILDGKYAINRVGEVRRMKDGLMIKPYVHQNRGIFYLRYKICGNNYFVHKFNFICWKGPVPKGFQVGHKLNNTFNNDIDNLELQTPEQNRNERRPYNTWRYAQ